MKILVFGSNGQVGRELRRLLIEKEDAVFLERIDADLLIPESADNAVRVHKPDLVINAAAWTNVDLAEIYATEAHAVNAAAPEAMAKACATLSIPFLHISSDYVFNGEGAEPFAPDRLTSPINSYGMSKLSGENAIRQSGVNYLILRTSWVFSKYGRNFLKTMLRLGQEKKSINIVSDQFGGPTPASAIAEALIEIGRDMCAGRRGGIYHFSGEPDVSWAEFAQFIMTTANMSCQINNIQTSGFPTIARRPLNSRLDCMNLTRDFQIQRPNWRYAATTIIRDFGYTS